MDQQKYTYLTFLLFHLSSFSVRVGNCSCCCYISLNVSWLSKVTIWCRSGICLLSVSLKISKIASSRYIHTLGVEYETFIIFFVYFICLWWSYLMSELARFVQDWKLNNKDLTKILSHSLSSSYNIHTVSHTSLHAAFIVIILPYTFVIWTDR